MAGEIVVGYDGQEGATEVLRTAVRLAGALGSPLIIVFGYQPISIGGEVNDLKAAVQDIAERVTAEGVAAARALDPSVEVNVELVDDRPAEALLRVGDEHDAFAVVVGTTGHGPIKGVLLGSVTYQVVHRSTRPVVVVPADPED